MDQNGPKMDQNGPKWTKMDQNGPKWTKMTKLDQNRLKLTYGPKCPKIDQN